VVERVRGHEAEVTRVGRSAVAGAPGGILTAANPRSIRSGDPGRTHDMDTHAKDRTGARAAPPTRSRPEPPALVKKLERRRETHRDHGKIYRGAFVIAGAVLVLGGLAMLVLPGPAFLVIPIGLAVLSLEFAWAGRMLDAALVQADQAKEKAAHTTRGQKILTAVAIGAAVAAFVVAAMLYDIPVLPV
jgi:uncharacterized protein (TIGR02611 family)